MWESLVNGGVRLSVPRPGHRWEVDVGEVMEGHSQCIAMTNDTAGFYRTTGAVWLVGLGCGQILLDATHPQQTRVLHDKNVYNTTQQNRSELILRRELRELIELDAELQ